MKTYKLIQKRSEREIYSFESILCNLTGTITSLMLIGFFLMMKLFGLYEILEFRYFNFLFLMAGLHSAFITYRNKISPEGIDYFKGLKMGLRITLTAVIPFVVFVGIYLKLDSNFMSFIMKNAEFGRFLSPGIAAGVIGIEGFVSGAIMTFIFMQYFKSNSETK